MTLYYNPSNKCSSVYSIRSLGWDGEDNRLFGYQQPTHRWRKICSQPQTVIPYEVLHGNTQRVFVPAIVIFDGL